MVLVGETGVPDGSGRIAYADFSEAAVKGGPPISERIAPPVAGDAHVIFDDKYEQNSIIYDATHDPIGGNGKIYRWTIGKSKQWDELLPNNNDFYGLVQKNGALYGAFNIPVLPNFTRGVDWMLIIAASLAALAVAGVGAIAYAIYKAARDTPWVFPLAIFGTIAGTMLIAGWAGRRLVTAR